MKDTSMAPQSQAHGAGVQRKAGAVASARDALLLRAAQRALKGLEGAAVRVSGPSGCSAVLGRGPEVANIRLHSLRPLWRAARKGGIGFAESYIDGDVETADLAGLMRFFAENFDQIADAGRGLFQVRSADKGWHRARANTRAGSKANIRAHYDLGNAFYKLWLDPGMTYSSGLYACAGQHLEAAQDAKYARVLEALQLGPGTSLLEIGCGWGGMAERVARAGAHVTAVTVSAEQLAYARERMEQHKLQTRAEIAFTDYRDVTGQYDRVVSIEMIEAVGEENWPCYFDALYSRLKLGGCAVVQAITIREQDFALYRSRPDFIQRHIFPGGMLPTVSILQKMSERAGLQFETVERFGPSYALTLRDWRSRFQAAWPSIAALGFDQSFKRKWEYYLTYCEVGFEQGFTDVGIYRMVKKGPSQ